MTDFSLEKVPDAVNYLITLYTTYRMEIISSIVIIIAFVYYIRHRKTGRKLNLLQEDVKLAKYLTRLIVKSSRDEESIKKCKFFIMHNPKVVNLQTKPQGCTLFQIACNYGVSELVSFMLEYGADINLCGRKNQNPLYLATVGIIRQKSHSFNVLKVLIDAGVPLNTFSEDGYTPLMLAATYGRDDVVKWLLMNGADPTMKRKNYTARDMAQMSGHESTAALLHINTNEEKKNE